MAAALLVPTFGLSPVQADEAPVPVDLLPHGRAVYAEHCASCHGDNGEGVDGVYDRELIGDKSVRELGGYIGHAMPDGSPEDVSGADAEAVADYIYQQFYSPIAQERLRPARVKASRLTARQLESAVADLFSDVGYIYDDYDPWMAGGLLPDELGVSAKFADGGRWNGSEEVFLDRLDMAFGPDGPPLPEGVPAPKQDTVKAMFKFGLIAPETGHYEITIDSDCAYELFFNHEEAINARTRSKDHIRRSVRRRLIAGRAYLFDVHATFPVLRNRKKDEKQPVHSASSTGDDTEFHFRVLWTPPGGTEAVIPTTAMYRHWVPATFASDSPMPADDRSTGYVQASNVSSDWWNNVSRIALEAADFAASRIQHYTGRDPAKIAGITDPAERQKQVDHLFKWMHETNRRAWRSKLVDEEAELKQRFAAEFAELGTEEAVRRHVLRMLLSPRFLYREVNFGPLDDDAIASWLSFTLLDTVPTTQMIEMASKGEFSKPGTLDWYLPQLMKDVRAKSKLRDFAHSWLHVDHFGDLSKSRERFPEFTPAVAEDLRTSLDCFLAEAFWGESSDFRRLMTSPELWVNAELAAIYGGQAERSDADDWSKVLMGSQKRAGLLTHPYLMAGFSYDAETSPIHRGVFLSRSILGRLLKPPPIAVAPVSPDLDPDLTQRQRVAMQTQAISCQSCHSMINPLGFSLEHFDALGRRREQAQGRPVDASGEYITKAGESVRFADVTELADWVAGSREAQEAFVAQLFQSMVNQPIRAFGPEMLPKLTDRFAADDYSVRRLAESITRESALRGRELFDTPEVANN